MSYNVLVHHCFLSKLEASDLHFLQRISRNRHNKDPLLFRDESQGCSRERPKESFHKPIAKRIPTVKSQFVFRKSKEDPATGLLSENFGVTLPCWVNSISTKQYVLLFSTCLKSCYKPCM